MVVCLAVLVTLVLGGVYYTRTGHAPAGQSKLVELKGASISTLQAGFNRESGKLRVILLLSPTCPTCLEGASAVEDVLKRHPDSQIVVFAVWEPMLSTDWSKPGTGTLERLSDGRVQQFWDADHTVAAALGVTEEATQIHPSYCTQRVLWDLIAAYSAGSVWNNTAPIPVFFDGTVVQSAAWLGRCDKQGQINHCKMLRLVNNRRASTLGIKGPRQFESLFFNTLSKMAPVVQTYPVIFEYFARKQGEGGGVPLAQILEASVQGHVRTGW